METTESSEPLTTVLPEEDGFHVIFVSVSYRLIFCVSLAGNSFLLWALLRQEDLRRTSNLLLLHLTLSDLIFTLPIPFWAMNKSDGWVLGEPLCRLLMGVVFLGCYSYMAFLTAMTVHCYRAVLHATTASSFRPNIHLLSAGLWLFCLAFSIPDMVFSQVMVYDGYLYCSGTIASYSIYFQPLVCFLLPFAVILFCCSRMWLHIQQRRMAKKKQAVRQIFLIVVGFFVCWAPPNILIFIYALSLHGLVDKELHHSDAYNTAYTVCSTLAFAHCCLSPVVHILGARKFRERLSGSIRWLSTRDGAQSFSTHMDETGHSAQGQPAHTGPTSEN